MGAFLTSELGLAVFALVAGALGTFLLLPHRLGAAPNWLRSLLGVLFSVISVALLAGLWKVPSASLNGVFFLALAAAAIASAVLMITSRDPVHSALWFASVVLATSGLFLLAGASFLAAGTVIVYAGAIIVTFLFVIMLAQQQGRAVYDRAARAPFLSTITCFLILGGVSYGLLTVKAEQANLDHGLVRMASKIAADSPNSQRRLIHERAVSPTLRLNEPTGVKPTDTPPHVAGLGAALFSDHLISVEAAGFLLFVALVAALAIATPKPPKRPAPLPASATDVPI